MSDEPSRPKINIPGLGPRDPLAALKLALAQSVNRCLAHVIASPVVTQRALEALAKDPAAMATLDAEDTAKVTAAVTEIGRAVDEVDRLARATVEAALNASAAQESAVESLPPEVRTCVKAGLRQAGAMIGAAGKMGGARPGRAS